MIDEARRTGAKLAVYKDGVGERGIPISVVFEFIQFEEVDVFFLRDGGVLTTDFGFFCGEDLADVEVYELALVDGLEGSDTYFPISILSHSFTKIEKGEGITYPIHDHHSS